jgi:cytochrome c-type biogenesis protein CcmH
MHRRDFLTRAAFGVAAVTAAPRLLAQQGVARDSSGAAPAQGTTSNLFDMDQEAAKTVRRPPKSGARSSMSAEERDALEHDIRCQCGCTLDVYTCRTTDFSCQVSPAMHRDVISLVEGGYSAQEILDAFVGTYGERALMAPKREGFNWAGYLVPFAALGAGAVAVVTVLRGMQRRTAQIGTTSRLDPRRASGTPDELAKLDAAIRRDD